MIEIAVGTIVVGRIVGLGVIDAGTAVVDIITPVGDLFDHAVAVGKSPEIEVIVLCEP